MSRSRLLSDRLHLIVALVTPFTPAGEVDRASLRRLVAHLTASGVDEFFAVGSTGEAPLLDGPARLAVIETVRAAAPDAAIYAGISGTGHRQAIAYAADAARAGADAAVVMCPYFVALDQAQLADFSTAIADAIPVPLVVYHHLRMPSPYAVPTLARLAAHANILGVKDTNGGDHNRCTEVLAATAGRPFRFFQGVEKLVLPTLAAGGHGAVLAQANIAPELYRALFTAWEQGDRERAAQLQQRAEALWTLFSRPEVRQSFVHFLHTLKLPLHQRGLIASTAGALPRAAFDPGFEAMVTTFLQEHLGPAAAGRAP